MPCAVCPASACVTAASEKRVPTSPRSAVSLDARMVESGATMTMRASVKLCSSDDNVRFLVAPGKKNNRHIQLALQCARKVYAGLVWQSDVEQHEIGES